VHPFNLLIHENINWQKPRKKLLTSPVTNSPVASPVFDDEVSNGIKREQLESVLGLKETQVQGAKRKKQRHYVPMHAAQLAVGADLTLQMPRV
jgi:hypothetical protein